jgi:transcription termination factor NusB
MRYFTDDSFAADQEFPDIKFRINKKHAYAIFEYSVRYMEEIDDMLYEYLISEPNNPLLLAVLRVAISEYKAHVDTPKNILLSEYTDIASSFLNESDTSCVNAVLHSAFS